MSTVTKIQWTHITWNPVTGCSKVSAGCAHCYAERFSRRLRAMGQRRYRNGFAVTCHPDVLEEPLHWKKPRRVFVNSMSDLFHEEVSFDFLRQIFDVMNRCPRHQFQILTKRSGRLADLAVRLRWTSNIWMGVTVEDAHNRHRIADLVRAPAAIRFLSCEPLLGPLDDLPLEGIHWVIVGGESGPEARPIREEWIDGIRLQCERAGAAFFFKQWSGPNVHRKGRLLHGREYRQYPSPEKEASFWD
jgi:protein gp37